jgi:hypothetical protein
VSFTTKQTGFTVGSWYAEWKSMSVAIIEEFKVDGEAYAAQKKNLLIFFPNRRVNGASGKV